MEKTIAQLQFEDVMLVASGRVGIKGGVKEQLRTSELARSFAEQRRGAFTDAQIVPSQLKYVLKTMQAEQVELHDSFLYFVRKTIKGKKGNVELFYRLETMPDIELIAEPEIEVVNEAPVPTEALPYTLEQAIYEAGQNDLATALAFAYSETKELAAV